MKKLLKRLLILILVLLVGLVVFVAFFLDGVINTQKDKYLPQVAKMLGRDVAAGEVSTRIFPVLGAELHDLKVGGPAAGAPALVQVDKVLFSFELWSALKSAGSDARLKALVITGLTINVERRADGTFDFDDVLARLNEGPPPEEKPEPLSPEARQFIENLQLERIALEGARLRFVDRQTGGAPATIEIGDLLIEATDISLTSPIEVVIKAAVFGVKQNFELRARFGPLPIGQENAPPPPVAFLSVAFDGLDLAPILPYLGNALPVGLKSARLEGKLRVDDPVGLKPAIDGDLRVAGLTFEGGEPFTLRVAPKLKQDRAGGRIDLESLAIEIDDMGLTAKGSIFGLITGRLAVEGLKIESKGLDFTRILARATPIKAALPKGSILEGPFSIGAGLDGDLKERRAVVDTDFTGAHIRVPGALDKPAGTPLSLKIDATQVDKNLTLKAFGLRAGPVDLKLAGTINDFDHPKVDLKGGTGSFPLDGLLRLLPSVRAAVPPDVKIAGTAHLDLMAKGNANAFDGKVDFKINGADLAVPGATLQGSGAINLTAKGSAGGALSAVLDANLTGMNIHAGDALNKRGGVPLEAKVDVGRSGAGALNVRTFAVAFGPIKLSGQGTLSADGTIADVQVKLEEFRLGDLDALLPTGLTAPMNDARVGTSAAVKGSLVDLSKIEAGLTDFTFKAAGSDLKGSASVANLSAPRIRFDFTSSNLDVDALVPPGPETAEEKGGAIVVPEIVKKIDADGHIRIAKGRARVLVFKDFDGNVTLKNGLLRFNRLGLKAFDGGISAAGTGVNFNANPPEVTFKLDLDKVDVERVLSEVADIKNALAGRASTHIDVTAKGLDWPTMQKSLSGALGLELAQGKLEGANLEFALHKELSAKIPFLKKPSGEAALLLRTLSGTFKIENGQMRLQKPMTLNSQHGDMKLEGGIGLDGILDLKGTVQLEPATLAKLSGGRIKVKKAIPAALRIGGTLTSPKIEGIEGAALAAVLLTAAGLGELDGLKDKAAEEAAKLKAQAEAEAAKLKARAEAEVGAAKAKAEAAKAEAEARAKAEVEAAKKKVDEAKKKAEDAKKKAADEAKKRLKGVF